MKNKYIIRSRISEKKFRQLLHLFCLDIETTKVARIVRLSRPAVNRLFDRIRERIAQDCERCSPFEQGGVELYEGYFGARRCPQASKLRSRASCRGERAD